MFERIFRLGLALLVTAWVARTLGPARYGELAFALAYVVLLLPIAQLGLTAVVVKEVVQRPLEAPTLLGTALVLRIGAGIFSWLAAVGLAYVSTGGSIQLAALTALIGAQLVLQSADVVDLWFQSQIQSKRAVIARLSAATLSSALKIGLILHHAPLWTFALMLSGDLLLNAMALVVGYRSFPTKGRWRWSTAVAGELLGRAWAFLLTGVLVTIYMRVDQIIIGRLAGPAQLGLYAAIMPFSQFWQIIPTTLGTSLAPYIARRAVGSETAYYRALRSVFLCVTASMIAVSVGMAIAAPLVVRLVLGPRYLSATNVLSIHVFTNIFVGMGSAWAIWAVNEGKGKLSLINAGAGTIVALLGNVLLVPRYGAIGAAFVAVGSYATSAFLMNALTCWPIFLLQLGRLPRGYLGKSSRMGVS